jgi:hypothetical protein
MLGDFPALSSTVMRNLPAMRQAQPGGPLTPETVWQQTFNEPLPAALAAHPENFGRAASERVMRFTADVDALPEPAGPGQARAGEFTREEKEIMKQAALRHGLYDVASLTAMMNTARAVSPALRSMSLACPTPRILAEGAGKLSETYRRAECSDEALGIINEMAVGSMDEGQRTRLAENLSSSLAASTAGVFVMAAGDRAVDDQHRANLLDIPLMMNALSNAAFASLGRGDAPDFRLFSQPLEGWHQAPGGRFDTSCMAVLADVAGRTRDRQGPVSEAVINLTMHEPPLSRDEWAILLPVVEKAANGQHTRMASKLLTASAADLLDAVRANEGRPLSNAQTWEAVTGSDMPEGVTDADFCDRLYEACRDRYLAEYRSRYPDVHEQIAESRFTSSLTNLLSPRKMLDILTRPDAVLSLADTHIDMRMSSLRDYGPDTAYGLTTDFRRRHQDSVMTFQNNRGEAYHIRPVDIPQAQNTPENPAFREIINHVRAMTAGEAQCARVLQAFNQAGLINARMLGIAFGAGVSEHGEASVTAVQQQDGRVVVDIVAGPSQPVHFSQRFTINTDGSHECTGFEMSFR